MHPFLSVFQIAQFHATPERCNITQPALTKAVQKLEYELNDELIRGEGCFTQLSDLGKCCRCFEA
jgi:DNA-binding transcriptional LysR family regulator